MGSLKFQILRTTLLVFLEIMLQYQRLWDFSLHGLQKITKN